jgi:hypothetical protein
MRPGILAVQDPSGSTYMKRMDIESLFQRHKSYITSYCADVKGRRVPGNMVSILRVLIAPLVLPRSIYFCERPWLSSRPDVFGRVAT